MSKSIIVTGASRGIGRAVTLQLLKNFNSNVVAIARSEKDLSSLKVHVEEDLGLKGRLEIVIGDVADENVAEQAVQKSLNAWGKLDGVVANAGISILQPMGKIADATMEDWKR
ncbi:14260_t:CDS:2 [Acaulospora colombiana]|uniref:14260_t:CDS:1 n=1 Tax=Acaulospora colombiana TaxID=27376 RepID=A0ACA9K341_9GLOM|nr:14260_t:CDS:2 [Acaulospora colombiana]